MSLVFKTYRIDHVVYVRAADSGLWIPYQVVLVSQELLLSSVGDRELETGTGVGSYGCPEEIWRGPMQMGKEQTI